MSGIGGAFFENEERVVASLWSGGVDSTIATYYFADKGWEIQPYHILIRMGSGKDARERDAVDKIYESLKDKFPNVRKPFHVKHRIRPSDRRNIELIELLRDMFGEKEVILGTEVAHLEMHSTDRREDSYWEKLQERTGVTIHDLRREGFNLKSDQFPVGVKLLGVEILEMTWSCHLWFKNPCGRCYACTERAEVFEQVGGEREGLSDPSPVVTVSEVSEWLEG